LAKSATVRWIEEYEIKGPTSARNSFQSPAQIKPKYFDGLWISTSGQILINQLRGRWMLIYKHYKGGTSTQCFQPHSGCAREKIQNPEPTKIGTNYAKDGLPHPLGSGPNSTTFWGRQTKTAVLTSNNSQ
jgi:hypothetical protein